MKIYMLILALALTGCEDCVSAHVHGDLYHLRYSGQRCIVRADNATAEIICKPKIIEE